VLVSSGDNDNDDDATTTEGRCKVPRVLLVLFTSDRTFAPVRGHLLAPKTTIADICLPVRLIVKSYMVGV